MRILVTAIKKVRVGMSIASIAGDPVPYPPAYVPGRVRLEGAVPYSKPLLIKYDDDELPAASAEILELYVVGQVCGFADRRVVGEAIPRGSFTYNDCGRASWEPHRLSVHRR